MATVDGLAFESPGEWKFLADEVLANVEFKTDGSFKRWDEIPVQHEIQCQWQMYVTGMEQTMLACLHGGRRFEVYEIEADPTAQAAMLDRVTIFREKYLLDPDAPPPEVDEHPATAVVIADLWADPTGAEIDLSRQTFADVKAWEAAKVRLKAAQGEVDRLKNRLAVALQDASVGCWQGLPVVTFKSQTRKEHMVGASSFRVLRQVGGKED
jgi:predicted phage-related endonuclease